MRGAISLYALHMIHVIDDNTLLLSVLTELMDVFGYSAKTFSCPTSYCEYASSNDYETPQIIITDVKMPGINGYQLISRVSRQHKDVKFIVMSGHHDPEDISSETEYIFIRKPFKPEVLQAHIDQLLQLP